jgi:hypothetical protein
MLGCAVTVPAWQQPEAREAADSVVDESFRKLLHTPISELIAKKLNDFTGFSWVSNSDLRFEDL